MLAFKFRKAYGAASRMSCAKGRSTKGRLGIAGTGDAFVFDDARNFIGDSHMLQSNLANAGELQGLYQYRRQNARF